MNWAGTRIESLERRRLLSAASDGVLLADNFPGSSLNPTNWYTPQWDPNGSTYNGDTQFQVAPYVPPVSGGEAHLPLNTYNPTALTPGDSFFGTEIISQQAFNVGAGLLVDVTAEAASGTPAGLVLGMFLYSAPATSTGNHNEIDFELLTNAPDSVQTNVYANQPLGTGSPTSASYSQGNQYQYHTYQILWLPNEVEWSVDGQVIRTESSLLPSGPMSLYLNTYVPSSQWTAAYNPNLQPSAVAADNQVYNFNVKSVTVTQLGPPAQVAFAAAPAKVVVNAPIASPVSVNVEDSAGDVVIDDNSDVTLSIDSGPAGAALGGTVTAAAVNGVATFSNLEFSMPGTYALEATDGNLTPAVSTPINAVVGWVDSGNWDQITGWAFDPSSPSTAVNVEVVITGGATPQIISADESRSDLQSLLGSSDHGFTYSTPMLSAGTHTAYVYAEDQGGNVLIGTATIVSQNSLFDEHYYLEKYPNVAAAVAAGQFATGYDHYIEYGQYEGYSPSPYWDESWYLKENPDVAAAVAAHKTSSGFMNYYLYGQYENREGLLYFNTAYYLENNADVAAAVTDGTVTSAFEHFCDYGQYEGRSPMLYFSSAVYDAYNQDIIPYVTGEPFTSDFEQFIEYGQFEDRTASDYYNEQVYLADNSDVAAAVSNGEFPDGFIQWLEYGQYEGRTAI